jgi:cell division protein FtsI/penicillin-binding protein 2
VQDLYEPGSTFKVITAAAGLEEHLVTPSQVVDCGNGSITIANITINEHDGHRYGLLSFEDVIVQLVERRHRARRPGPRRERFYDWIRRFGFGERSGLPLPGERSGLLRRTINGRRSRRPAFRSGRRSASRRCRSRAPSRRWRPAACSSSRASSKRVVDDEGNTSYEPPRHEPRRVMSEKTAAVLNEILKNVVARGTGEKAASRSTSSPARPAPRRRRDAAATAPTATSARSPATCRPISRGW